MIAILHAGESRLLFPISHEANRGGKWKIGFGMIQSSEFSFNSIVLSANLKTQMKDFPSLFIIYMNWLFSRVYEIWDLFSFPIWIKQS